MSSGAPTVALGRTRCYWCILRPNLDFIFLDPILHTHLGAESKLFLQKNLLDFVHPDEAPALRQDLLPQVGAEGGIEGSGVFGSITQVRYSRVPRIRRLLGCAAPETDPEANSYVYDSEYLKLLITTSWIGGGDANAKFGQDGQLNGAVLAFFHATEDKNEAQDNDEQQRSAWTNWCGPHVEDGPYLDAYRCSQLVDALSRATGFSRDSVPANNCPPPYVFQILNHLGQVIVSFPNTGDRYNAEDYALLAREVLAKPREPNDDRTSCTRRMKQGTLTTVESVVIMYGAITFACFETGGIYFTSPKSQPATAFELEDVPNSSEHAAGSVMYKRSLDEILDAPLSKRPRVSIDTQANGSAAPSLAISTGPRSLLQPPRMPDSPGGVSPTVGTASAILASFTNTQAPDAAQSQAAIHQQGTAESTHASSSSPVHQHTHPLYHQQQPLPPHLPPPHPHLSQHPAYYGLAPPAGYPSYFPPHPLAPVHHPHQQQQQQEAAHHQPASYAYPPHPLNPAPPPLVYGSHYGHGYPGQPLGPFQGEGPPPPQQQQPSPSSSYPTQHRQHSPSDHSQRLASPRIDYSLPSPLQPPPPPQQLLEPASASTSRHHDDGVSADNTNSTHTERNSTVLDDDAPVPPKNRGGGRRPIEGQGPKFKPGPGACLSCGKVDSPEWRKGPDGKKSLCNACGLRYARQVARKAKLADKLANGGETTKKGTGKKKGGKKGKNDELNNDGPASGESSENGTQAGPQHTSHFEQQGHVKNEQHEPQHMHHVSSTSSTPQINFSAAPSHASLPANSPFFSGAPSHSGQYMNMNNGPPAFHLPQISASHLPPSFDGQRSAGAMSNRSTGSAHSPFDSPHGHSNHPFSSNGGANGRGYQSSSSMGTSQSSPEHHHYGGGGGGGGPVHLPPVSQGGWAQTPYSQAYQSYSHAGWAPSPLHPPSNGPSTH